MLLSRLFGIQDAPSEWSLSAGIADNVRPKFALLLSATFVLKRVENDTRHIPGSIRVSAGAKGASTACAESRLSLRDELENRV